MLKKIIFKDFNEYWYYARYLCEKQRSLIFGNLSKDQKKHLENSYVNDGWNDLFYRNEIDSILDDLKEKYKFDILDLRAKVFVGKSVYVSIKYWKVLNESLRGFSPESVRYVLSGIRGIVCEENRDVVLVVPD